MCCKCCSQKEPTNDNQNIDEIIVKDGGSNKNTSNKSLANDLEMKKQSNTTLLPSLKNDASMKKAQQSLTRENSNSNKTNDNDLFLNETDRAKTPHK